MEIGKAFKQQHKNWARIRKRQKRLKRWQKWVASIGVSRYTSIYCVHMSLSQYWCISLSSLSLVYTLVQSSIIFPLFLCSCIYCVHMSLFMSMFILLCLLSLDGYWTISQAMYEKYPQGEEIPSHLGIVLLMLLFYVIPFTFKQSPFPFILCHLAIYFQVISISFYFMSSHLISCTSPLPLYFIAHTRTYYIQTPKKKNSTISLKWFLNLHQSTI